MPSCEEVLRYFQAILNGDQDTVNEYYFRYWHCDEYLSPIRFTECCHVCPPLTIGAMAQIVAWGSRHSGIRIDTESDGSRSVNFVFNLKKCSSRYPSKPLIDDDLHVQHHALLMISKAPFSEEELRNRLFDFVMLMNPDETIFSGSHSVEIHREKISELREFRRQLTE
jgi:hypothetical protein